MRRIISPFVGKFHLIECRTRPGLIAIKQKCKKKRRTTAEEEEGEK